MIKRSILFVALVMSGAVLLPANGSGIFYDSGQVMGDYKSVEVALGDLDGDGDLDAFVANYESPNQVWVNQGGAQGGTPGIFLDSGQELGTSMTSDVELGDLDGDGDLDAMVSSQSGANSVWLNDGSGTFTSSGQSLGGSIKVVVALGDVDNDGDLDAFNGVSGSNELWINQGGVQGGTQGVFLASAQWLGGSTSCGADLGDLDGDGDLDIFVGNYNQPNEVWINQGGDQGGTLGVFLDSGQTISACGSNNVTLADMDNDGDLDACVANGPQSSTVWLNDGTGTFDTARGLGGNDTLDVILGDVDGDNDLDVMKLNYYGQANRVMINQGGIQGGTLGVFVDSGQLLGNSPTWGGAMGDLDGDGDPDAFVANTDYPDGVPNRIWLNNSIPTDITLSHNQIEENRPGGTVIGTFATADTDTLDTHTYSLVSGEGDDDNGSFSVDGNVLQSAEVFDYVTKDTYSVRVRTDDGHDGTFEKIFTVYILREDDLFGSGGGGEDYGKTVLQTGDGGYVLAGYTDSFTNGGYDFLVYKLDANGNQQWQKNLGGTGDDFAVSIEQTADGGYIVAGFGNSFTYGEEDFLVYKLDAGGGKRWRRNFGGTGRDRAFSVIPTADGGYMLVGHTSSYSQGAPGTDVDFLVYKLDDVGNVQKNKNFGGLQDDYATAVIQAADGGYLIMGDTDSYNQGAGDYDFLLYRLDAKGNLVWRRNFGGAGDEYCWDLWPGGPAISQTADGGFVFCGMTDSFTYGMMDFMVYKLDANGNEQWWQHFGGAFHDEAYSIVQTADGGYIVAGVTESFTLGESDFLVYKLDSEGIKQWRKNFGGVAGDYAFSIRQTADGGYIVMGTTFSFVNTPGSPDFLVYKLDADGNKQWRKNFGG